MLKLLLSAGIGAAGMFFAKEWLTGKASTTKAGLLADEAALKAYLSNLEEELQTKYSAIAAEVVTELDTLKAKGLTAAAAGLTEVLTVIQAELAKLS